MQEVRRTSVPNLLAKPVADIAAAVGSATDADSCIEFDDNDGVLSNPRYVKTAAKPERTISFRLEQTDEGTILQVKNLFTKNIIYDCLIQHSSEQRLRKTTIISVQARFVSFEMWPYPVA